MLKTNREEKQRKVKNVNHRKVRSERLSKMENKTKVLEVHLTVR